MQEQNKKKGGGDCRQNISSFVIRCSNTKFIGMVNTRIGLDINVENIGVSVDMQVLCPNVGMSIDDNFGCMAFVHLNWRR